MILNKYTFENYAIKDVKEIAKLESHLWRTDYKSNYKKFLWKHINNPFIDDYIGVVARYNREIVGFRGFCVIPWRLNGKSRLLLSPSDVVVHPDHRRHGLFSRMNKKAMELYKKDFPLFVNLSSNQYSTPGYLKQGWCALVEKHYLRYVNPLSLIIKSVSSKTPSKDVRGQIGDIEFMDGISIKKMCEVNAKISKSETKIYLIKDKRYFRWKYALPKYRFRSYFNYQGDEVQDYLIVAYNASSPLIYDFEGTTLHGITNLIKFILSENYFTRFSILNVNLGQSVLSKLRENHFFSYKHLMKMRQGRSYELPILIRPVKEVFERDDWIINGVDVRKIENWKFREVNFD